MDDFMRPAAARGAWLASAAAALILLTGFAAIRYAAGQHPLTPQADSR
jgi:hypothetical protein